MTSVSPAHSRLQSSSMEIASGFGQHRASDLPPGGPSQHSDARQEADEDEVEFLDSRPAKRRKLSTYDSSRFAIPEPVDTPTASRHDGLPQAAPSTARYSHASWLTTVSSTPSNEATVQSQSMQMPPLPERPWSAQRLSDGQSDHERSASRIRKNNIVPTTPDSMSTPAIAPLLEDGRSADYFPWVGKHPEDNLNENTVKNGYFDRAPNPLEKESNTAKTSLSNAFRHRAGLQSLSALFSLVLERKASRGAFSSISSFKGPPPRVTLTEVKRKSWISDLANLAVPLKRLSKTIPQGIRGLSLLEQCLLNQVPISRALWFAKCVGANEIRTLKRKGINPMVAQGAEAKWLREWTLNVEQFLEQTLAQCDQHTWKKLSSYALQLATRLYAENLLDRDHYLDWMVKSLAASKVDVLPFWLMVAEMHRIDLLAFRKRGKQFAESIIGKINAVHNYDLPETFQPLIDVLARAIRGTVQSKPICFLMPDRWVDCKHALDLTLNLQNHADRDRLEYLQRLNERTSTYRPQNSTSSESVADDIVDLLDSASTPFDVAALSKDLLQLCPDTTTLITNCLQWCVSRYRTGLARIYLTVRLCRRWRRNEVEIDPIFQNFLQNNVNVSSIDYSALRHLFCELTRSRTLSVSKHSQWLTVRGLPRPSTFTAADVLVYTAPDGTKAYLQSTQGNQQLLTDCCLVGLSDHVRNLRDTILSKGGFDTDAESQVIELCKDYVRRVTDDPGHLQQERSRPRFGSLPWAIRSELSYHVRHLVTKLFPLADSTPSSSQQPSPMTFAQVNIIRNLLEELQDLALLADVLRIAAFSKNEEVLSTVTDTITLHAAAFSAMGALHPLQSLVCQAYLTLRPVKTCMPTFSTSLIQLCQQYPIKTAPLRALQQDFVRGDRSRAVAACSPFSDGVAESLQQAGETFYDDFEAILQTESNMNEDTLSQLFEVLTGRIEKLPRGHTDDTDILQLCQLLCRLKLCRRVQGDVLLTRWVRTGLLKDAKQPFTSVLLLNLIATRCIGLDVILEVFQSLPPQAPSKQMIRVFIADIVANKIPQNISQGTWYAIKLAVQKVIVSQPNDMLDILSVEDDTSAKEVVSSLINQVILDADPANVLPKLAADALLKDLRDHDTASLEAEIANLMEKLGPLAVSHVQHRLRTVCQEATAKSDEASQDIIANAVCKSLKDDLRPLCQSPRSIRLGLGALGSVIGHKVRYQMESEFYESLPKFLHGKTPSYFPLPSTEDDQHAAQALRLVCMVNTDQSTPQQGTGVNILVEKLSAYLKCLTPASASAQSSSATISGPGASPAATAAQAPQPSDTLRVFLMATISTLELLLSMVCLKRAALNTSQSQPSPAAAKQNQQDQIKLVGLIISIATNQAWSLIVPNMPIQGSHQKSTEVIDFMFDVAATLVDDMAEESRMFCARLLKDKIKDPRVQWLLGSVKMFGSLQFKDITAGLEVHNDNKGLVGDFKPKVWEMLENGGTSNDACLGLGLFGAKHI